MKITKMYCDRCFKEIDTRQDPKMNSNGSVRNFRIMRTDLVSICNCESDVLLCDDCYKEIETILTDKQTEEKNRNTL